MTPSLSLARKRRESLSERRSKGKDTTCLQVLGEAADIDLLYSVDLEKLSPPGCRSGELG